jgi:hypothetical protein
VLNYALCHRDVWRSGCIGPPIFLTSELVIDEGSASRPCRFTQEEKRSHISHWVRGWVDPRTGMDDIEKWKLFTLLGLEIWPLCRLAHRQYASVNTQFNCTSKYYDSGLLPKFCYKVCPVMSIKTAITLTRQPKHDLFSLLFIWLEHAVFLSKLYHAHMYFKHMSAYYLHTVCCSGNGDT